MSVLGEHNSGPSSTESKHSAPSAPKGFDVSGAQADRKNQWVQGLEWGRHYSPSGLESMCLEETRAVINESVCLAEWLWRHWNPMRSDCNSMAER